jgi:heme/copper-type cytochrome/quinol oxidase subunit 2
MFLGVFLGGVLSTAIYLVYFNPRYKAEARRHAPAPTPPEVRIEFCLMAAPLLVIAFFVFGWTSYPTLSWVGPCIGGAILGAAVLAIFVSLFNYVGRAGVKKEGDTWMLTSNFYRLLTPIFSRLLQVGAAAAL